MSLLRHSCFPINDVPPGQDSSIAAWIVVPDYVMGTELYVEESI